ncbi:MAG: recombination mediator RecR [Chloroflexia bacterium]
MGRYLPGPVAHLVDELVKLPGIGPKSASRLAYYLLRVPEEESRALAEAILAMRQRISYCSRCFNLTETDPCRICSDETRDRTRICVVEQPLDVVAIERTGRYTGLYHVLHGSISPVEGIGPEDLRVRELLTRVRIQPIEEVILATNPSLEGDATAMYLAQQLIPMGVRVTRLAHGLPMGGELEYADEITLSRALEGRREM